MTGDKVRINFELLKELFEKLRKIASKNERTYPVYLRQLIKKAVDNH